LKQEVAPLVTANTPSGKTRRNLNNSFSEEEIWATAFLIQPTLGPPIYSGANEERKNDKSNIIYKKLGMEGIYRFRGIFDKNTQDDVKSFFADPLIMKLWPGILNHFNEELYN